ncbi:MAG TPA: low temperature requirement protein A [Solirubrobacteraceae bacterium]|jgi:low temperature requirement protein LtrA|nr:low temperature requirement protein A [Solirubrobacteraceae bacterium]
MSAVAERIEDEPVEVEQEVTPLELFFDLVFVFAITQVTGFVSADATWTRLIEGLAILAVLWFAWEAYVWLANSAASDEGAVRVVLLFAMGALLILSLAVPRAFGDDGLVFGVAYFVVRAAHICAYLIVARGDEQLRGVVLRLATTVLPGAALLVVAGALDGTAQALCWVGALAIDYGGLMVRGVAGWRVAAKHFAERHGLIIIIALGESIVALGVGAGGLELDAGLITAALLGIAIAGAMWWAYFDLVALVAERRLRTAPRDEQVRIARDSFTYLHLPMVAGIVVFALGVKKTLAHVDHELDTVPAVALCGGAALYFLALSAFKRRNIGSFNYPRLVAASALVALAPIATAIPALLALGLVAAISVALVSYEFVAYAEARDRIRHGSA